VNDAATFEAHRRHLLGIGYRLLGSMSLAEDAVQEAWIRFSLAEGVEKPRPWLATVVTRLCLDQLGSARARREQYVGPWLPEPVRDVDLAADEAIDGRRSLSLAALLLYERLGPVERGVVVLRDAFGWAYDDIAPVVRRSTAACRQAYRRAHQKLGERPADPSAGDPQADALVLSLLWAARTGDEATLGRLLAEDADFASDGGGLVVAAGRPLHGRAPVARVLAGITRGAPENARISFEQLNGERAILAWYGDRLMTVFWFTVRGAQVTRVRVMASPVKLASLARSLGVDYGLPALVRPPGRATRSWSS
jgi:RNA polymerase sigma-70 factor (ECF subfamily)